MKMEPELAGKCHRLQELLERRKRIAVAFSGGVDSSFLAYTAATTLGIDRTLILHASSCLISQRAEKGAQRFVNEHLPAGTRYRVVLVNPLHEPAFARNQPDRCYICKRLIYKQLLAVMREEGFTELADGTNCDDLGQDRPGIRAVRELQVNTPLVAAGFTKTDIRAASAACGLFTADLPSDSCLATRIGTETPIEEEKLAAVEQAEAFLHSLGYAGCRVYPEESSVVLAVRSENMAALVSAAERSRIITYFQSNGYHRVLLDLHGR